jgi:hemerythrin
MVKLLLPYKDCAMPKIKWIEKFSVHNEKIDAQHKKWIEIFNIAHDRMMGKPFDDKAISIGEAALIEMINYTKYHFSFEEEFMKKIGFPKIAEHQKCHQAFILKLDDLALQIHQGTFVLDSEIIKVIENWLVDHILNEDQKIKSITTKS